jgi:multicomponent K+:H+ antiporter subunit A
MALLFPVIAAVAVFLLLRGHDQPGGGFAAGITMAVAFIVQYMARGTVWVETHLRILPVRWIGAGLLLAGGTGAAAWLFDRPFLTSSFSYLDVPLIGDVPLASALFFDLGVFFLVVGATVLMLIAIAHQSTRSHRVARGRADAPADAPAASPMAAPAAAPMTKVP